jgi:hypothetical protein
MGNGQWAMGNGQWAIKYLMDKDTNEWEPKM